MRYDAAKQPAPFVELDAGNYMFEMLMEAGPVKSAAMGGAVGLDWPEITAYLTEYPCEVDHYERVLLRKMSNAFATGLSEGANSFSKSPMDRDGVAD